MQEEKVMGVVRSDDPELIKAQSKALEEALQGAIPPVGQVGDTGLFGGARKDAKTSRKVSTGTTLNVVKPHELIEALQMLIRVGRPAMVWGAPGVGKSQIWELVANIMSMIYRPYFAILMDPVDLHGIPYRDQKKNRTRWAPPGEFPEDDGNQYLLNLDEITAAAPAVQASLYQLVLKGQIGEYVLPQGSAIGAAGNRESDRGVAHTMPTPLVSRFIHYTLEPDPADWLGWAATHNIHDDVLFFISLRPDLLHIFDPKIKNTPFPCPRTWEFVSDLVKDWEVSKVSPRVQLATLAGTVGEGSAMEFSAFQKIKGQLPHPKAVLGNPTGAPIPDRPDALLALCSALSRYTDDTNFDSLLTYADRLPRKEVGEFLVNCCIKRNEDLQFSRGYVTWAAAH